MIYLKVICGGQIPETPYINLAHNVLVLLFNYKFSNFLCYNQIVIKENLSKRKKKLNSINKHHYFFYQLSIRDLNCKQKQNSIVFR
jgi:hypothetical protein